MSKFLKIIDVTALSHQHIVYFLLHATGSRSATPRIYTVERTSASSCAEAIACRRVVSAGVGGGGHPRGGSRSYGERFQRHWASGRRHDAALSIPKRENTIAKCRDTRTRSLERISVFELAKTKRTIHFPKKNVFFEENQNVEEDHDAAPKLTAIDFSKSRSISRSIVVDRRLSRFCK